MLIATPYWRDASRRVSWQAATATAVSSCDRTATALVHQLGTTGGGGEGADRFRWRRILKLFIVFGLFVRMFMFSYSAFFLPIFHIRLFFILIIFVLNFRIRLFFILVLVEFVIVGR